jgi:hypothetical protein
MFESTGEITEVQEFSDSYEQVTIEIKIPPPLGEEGGETRSNNLILPKGSANVGDIVRIEIRPG